MLDLERQGCSQPCRYVFKSRWDCARHEYKFRVRVSGSERTVEGLPSDGHRVVVTGFSSVCGRLETVVSLGLSPKERVVQVTHSWVSHLPNSQAIACLQCIVALGANGAAIIRHAHFHWHSVHSAG